MTLECHKRLTGGSQNTRVVLYLVPNTARQCSAHS